jgi:serine/threonine protein kinase
MQSDKSIKNFSVFNDQWKVLENLGEGNTAKVYLCENMKDPSQRMALKLLKQDFLAKGKHHIKSVEQEISILSGLEHKNITKIIDYGSDGVVVKASGKRIGFGF